MTDEERQNTMNFILAQQAQFWAGMQRLEESQAELKASQERAAARMERSDERMDRGYLRIDRLERVLKLMIKAGQRARKNMRAQDEKFAEVREMIASLGRAQSRNEEAQARSDRRLAALIDIVREQRNSSA